MKKLLNIVKILIGCIILIILIGLLSAFGIISYSEIQATNAKEYLIKKYDFTDWNVFAVKATEYVYEDKTDCSTLWIKKCTDNKDLYKEFTFITTNGEVFEVTEYNSGIFVDTYKKG